MASHLSGRTVEIAHAATVRWLVEGGVPDWKSSAGWGTWTKQPGEEGARRSVILRLLGDHGLFVPPDQQAPRTNNLPA
jgi:hypothetical protein